MNESTFPILYKKSSKNATQIWTIKVAYGDETAHIVTEFGQKYGKMQISTVTLTQGKNAGKSNSTTVAEQAYSEAESKWKKQLDKGYGVDENPVKNTTKPMLAHPYQDHAHKIDWTLPVYVQPKMDGIRCLAFCKSGKVNLVSRMGKPIDTVPHINSQLETCMTDGETWDGELYFHGDFQKNISLVKKNQAGSELVEFHIYDCFPLSSEGFTERFAWVRAAVELYKPTHLKSVETIQIYSPLEVEKYHTHFLELGFEGLMIRTNDCPYKSSRSSNLLKLKSFQDQEYKVVGAREGIGRFVGKAIFMLETEDGKTFESVTLGDDATRMKYWSDWNAGLLSGKYATIKFFEKTDDNIPRFPVLVSFRDYE